MIQCVNSDEVSSTSTTSRPLADNAVTDRTGGVAVVNRQVQLDRGQRRAVFRSTGAVIRRGGNVAHYGRRTHCAGGCTLSATRRAHTPDMSR
jgi:hypothetical protein